MKGVLNMTKTEKDFCKFYATTRNAREAAIMSGISVFAERKGQKMLLRDDIRCEIERIESEMDKSKNEALAGYRRLAFGSIADAVRLIIAESTGEILDVEKLDLFSVSDIKKVKGGGMEIKFFDRQKALESIEAIENTNEDDSAIPFYKALQNSAKAFSSKENSYE